MSATLLALYKALTANYAVLYCVRTGKARTLVGLYATGAEAEAAAKSGQVFDRFEANAEEQALIDMCCPPTAPKADPMINRLKKSEIEKPVQFVIRYVMANPDLDRKTQIANLVEMGIATYTARTQVQVARQRLAKVKEAQAAAAAEAAQADADDAEQADEVNEE